MLSCMLAPWQGLAVHSDIRAPVAHFLTCTAKPTMTPWPWFPMSEPSLRAYRRCHALAPNERTKPGCRRWLLLLLLLFHLVEWRAIFQLVGNKTGPQLTFYCLRYTLTFEDTVLYSALACMGVRARAHVVVQPRCSRAPPRLPRGAANAPAGVRPRPFVRRSTRNSTGQLLQR